MHGGGIRDFIFLCALNFQASKNFNLEVQFRIPPFLNLKKAREHTVCTQYEMWHNLKYILSA
jgi:hypothetical protein